MEGSYACIRQRFSRTLAAMLRPYRQRRGPYAMARPSRGPSVARFLILLAIAGLILYLLGRFVINLFAGAASAERAKVTMRVVEDPVSVAVDGGLLQRTEDEAALYAGDRVTTGNGGHAELELLDGTLVRLDEQTDATVAASERSEEESAIDLILAAGALWMETPDEAAISGPVVRTVQAGGLEMTFDSSTKAVVVDGAVLVFEDGGKGVTVAANDGDVTIEVSEGQRFVVDGELDADNIASYRSALTREDWDDPFVVESMNREELPDQGSGDTLSEGGDLTVLVPADNANISTATVRVEGELNSSVDRVRVNGYLAAVNRAEGTFSQELAMPATGEMSILVEALNENGVVTVSLRRTVKREAATVTMEAPTITVPAKTGETYTTQETELVMRGTAPAGTQGIMVNEYKLQLYKPGNTDWSYLASIALGNMKAGTNTYNVVAIAADGTQSPAATITIVQGATASTTSAGTTASQAATSSIAQVDESTLPQNRPLSPGTLSITAPTSGSEYTATGAEVVIYGTAPAETATMWVNGYRLQLYQPGRRTWNYLAKTDIGNLKRGRNTYSITARDSENRILDKMEYVIIFNPR